MSANPFNIISETETILAEKMSATPNNRLIKKTYAKIFLKGVVQGTIILVGATVLVTAALLTNAAINQDDTLVEKI